MLRIAVPNKGSLSEPAITMLSEAGYRTRRTWRELVLVDDYGFEKPSTKAAVAMLKALGLEGKRLTIIVRDEDVNAYLSFRNIPKTFIITADEANTYDLVNNNAVLMPADIAAHFGEVLA